MILGLLEQKWGWVHFCIFLLASYLLLSLSRLNFVLFLTHIFFGKRQPQKTRNHILIILPCNANRPTTNMAIDAAGPVTDNCYIDNIQVTDGGAIPTTGCWYSETFTLTATDGCGNVTVCQVTYQWTVDTEPPHFAHCPSGPVVLPCNATRPTAANAVSAAGAVTDNCPGGVYYTYCLPPLDGAYDGSEDNN